MSGARLALRALSGLAVFASRTSSVSRSSCGLAGDRVGWGTFPSLRVGFRLLGGVARRGWGTFPGVPVVDHGLVVDAEDVADLPGGHAVPGRFGAAWRAPFSLSQLVSQPREVPMFDHYGLKRGPV